MKVVATIIMVFAMLFSTFAVHHAFFYAWRVDSACRVDSAASASSRPRQKSEKFDHTRVRNWRARQKSEKFKTKK
jgi:hypothetical protein